MIALRNLSRRDFTRIATGAVAVGVASCFVDYLNAFAAGGGGTGDDSGSTTGGSDPSYYGYMWVWHDNGGFADGAYAPEFGWNEASRDGFWNGPMAARCTEVGNRILGTNRSSFNWYGGNDAYNHYKTAADEALQKARDRADSNNARIVAAGWSVGYYSRSGKIGTMYMQQWSTDRTAANLLSKDARNTVTGASDTGGDGAVKYYIGNSISDLGKGVDKNDAGWSLPVKTKSGATYSSWRDYIWHLHQTEVSPSRHDYRFIVIAVADTEVMSTGYITTEKQPLF